MIAYTVRRRGENLWLERDGAEVEFPGRVTNLHLAMDVTAGAEACSYIEATVRIDLAPGEVLEARADE